MTTAALRSYPEVAPASVVSFDESAFLDMMRQGLLAAPLPPTDPVSASLIVAPDVGMPERGHERTAELPPDLKLPAGWYADKTHTVASPLPIKAATLGFVAGILFLVPGSILWSRAQAPKGPSAADMAQLAMTIVSEATAHAGRLSPGPAFDQARVERIAARTLTAPTFEPQIDEARRRIAAKDIQGARDVLATATAAKSPRALFAMAETYDPNLLAAWGASGINADPERARALYTAARSLGHVGAAGRLDALQ